MSLSEAPAGIGHNQPPREEVLKDQFRSLLDDAEAIAQRANATKREIETEEQLEPVAKLVKEARALRQLADEKRQEENQPHLDAQRTNNAFFNAIKDRMQRIQDAFEAAAGEFNRKKEIAARREAEERARLEREAAKKALEEAAAAEDPFDTEQRMRDAEEADLRARRAQAAASGSPADLSRTRTAAGTVSSTTKWTFTVADYSKIPLEELRPFFAAADIDKALRGYVRANKNTKPIAGVEIHPDTKATFR